MPPSGATFPTCWKMHRRASHAISIHGRGFSTFCRECVASQHVAGPYTEDAGLPLSQSCGSQNKQKLVLCFSTGVYESNILFSLPFCKYCFKVQTVSESKFCFGPQKDSRGDIFFC